MSCHKQWLTLPCLLWPHLCVHPAFQHSASTLSSHTVTHTSCSSLQPVLLSGKMPPCTNVSNFCDQDLAVSSFFQGNLETLCHRENQLATPCSSPKKVKLFTKNPQERKPNQPTNEKNPQALFLPVLFSILYLVSPSSSLSIPCLWFCTHPFNTRVNNAVLSLCIPLII